MRAPYEERLLQIGPAKTHRSSPGMSPLSRRPSLNRLGIYADLIPTCKHFPRGGRAPAPPMRSPIVPTSSPLATLRPAPAHHPPLPPLPPIRGHGVPGSHGPSEGIVNDQRVTFRLMPPRPPEPGSQARPERMRPRHEERFLQIGPAKSHRSSPGMSPLSRRPSLNRLRIYADLIPTRKHFPRGGRAPAPPMRSPVVPTSSPLPPFGLPLPTTRPSPRCRQFAGMESQGRMDHPKVSLTIKGLLSG